MSRTLGKGMAVSAICLLLLAAGAVSLAGAIRQPDFGPRIDYELASTSPPEGWRVQTAFVDMDFEHLCRIAHTVAVVEVVDIVETIWLDKRFQYTRYSVQVTRMVVSRRPDTVTDLVVYGGPDRILYNLPLLRQGRRYLVIIKTEVLGNTTFENFVGHPLAVFPLVSQDMVERWWPAPPWAAANPFVDLDTLVKEVLLSAGD